MIELGKKQKLLVVKTVDFGIYLGEDRNAPQNERVLLPSKQVPDCLLYTSPSPRDCS